MEYHATSVGDLVPIVKSDPADSSDVPPMEALAPPPPFCELEEEQELDKDVLCPICMQIIKDAFLTSCGHSFCYMCIATHLQNKSDCPCCSHFLTTSGLYPNFLLNKLLMRSSARQKIKTATPLEQLRLTLEQGCDASAMELESLLSLITEKKRKMEQEEVATHIQILLDFLHCLKKKKLDELSEIQSDLQFIKEDIHAVEKCRIDLYRKRDSYSTKRRMLDEDPSSNLVKQHLLDKHSGAIVPRIAITPRQCYESLDNDHNRTAVAKSSSCHLIEKKDVRDGTDSESLTQSGLVLARKKRVHAQFNDLQDCYLQKRQFWARRPTKHKEWGSNYLNRFGYTEGLEDFQSVLSSFTRYSRMRVVAELRHGDLFHAANIVSSIEFDRDNELFATAGVSRRIKIFEFSSMVNELSNEQCPVVEMSTRSKLSCLSWNKSTKYQIASSDYEGTVTVWDVTTLQSVMEYEEHEKRAWSVDFSPTEPSMLVSGSDDCKVKVWCTKQEASALSIDMKANICSVKYNPASSIHIAVGSADHHIHYYDLRKINEPLYIFSGHRKAVSYVKFLSNNELASASTDSTLRLWDVKENVLLRRHKGHINKKNFVGLTVNKEYLACGSETNDVFVYHKAISKPAAWHKFSSDTDETEADAGSYFISAVCWRSDSPTMLVANSQGTIKALVLAP